MKDSEMLDCMVRLAEGLGLVQTQILTLIATQSDMLMALYESPLAQDPAFKDRIKRAIDQIGERAEKLDAVIKEIEVRKPNRG